MSLNGKAEGEYKLRGRLNGLNAVHGYSAYELAVINGFDGTEEEWLASLKGEKGEKGDTGPRGVDGTVAFEELTDEQRESLRGPEGPQGPQGPRGLRGQNGETIDAIEYNPSSGLWVFRTHLGSELQVTGPAIDTKDVETDPMYFSIDADGVVSLHPEYRGACPATPDDAEKTDAGDVAHFKQFPYAVSNSGVGRVGAMNDRLPQNIVVPSEINGVKVVALAPGMFHGNDRVTSIKIPAGITEIPTRFCDNARKLQYVTGTENVKKIGDSAFRITGLRKAYFPNLEELGECVFAYSAYLTEVEIGNNITELPRHTFVNNVSLVRIIGGNAVTAVGERAFSQASSLEEPSFIGNLKKIGERAFSRSGFDYDWDSLVDCEFGDYATSKQVHGDNKFWVDVKYQPCEIPIVSCFCQADPEWKDVPIGTSDYSYSKGCLTFSSLASYSAMTGEVFATPMEYVDKVAAVEPDLVKIDSRNYAAQREWFDALGFDLSEAYPYTAENLEIMYAELAKDNMVITDCIIDTASFGHAVAINGVTADGRVMCVNSGTYNQALTRFGVYEARRYALPIQNLVSGDNKFCVVKKKPADAYFDIDTATRTVFLKEEYRGACPSNKAQEQTPLAISKNGIEVAGDKNNRLPKDIVIPEAVKGVTVEKLAPGMFRGNHQVTSIQIPESITEIPLRFCDNAKQVRHVTGTQNVTKLGLCAFQTSPLEEAYFPALREIEGTSTFANCFLLKTAVIGNEITAIPDKMFIMCENLSLVDGGSKVTSVGSKAFSQTLRLKELSFIDNVRSIGDNAFRNSRVKCDWKTLQDNGCSFGTTATAMQINSTDFWSGVEYTPCEIPVVSYFHQTNPAWSGTKIREDGEDYYGNAKWLFACLAAYSSMSSVKFNDPLAYVAKVKSVNPALVEAYADSDTTQRAWLGALGYEMSEPYHYTAENLKLLYDELAADNVVVTEVIEYSAWNNQVVAINGVTADGELMIVSSNDTEDEYGVYDGNLYSIPVQNTVKDGTTKFYIVKKK